MVRVRARVECRSGAIYWGGLLSDYTDPLGA